MQVPFRGCIIPTVMRRWVMVLGLVLAEPAVGRDLFRIPRPLTLSVARDPLVRDREVRQRLQPFLRIRRTVEMIAPRIQRAPLDSPVVMRVLAIRVQFPEEIPDDPQTTGNGRFVLEPQGNPIDTITPCGDTFYNPFYDPPHDRRYFERQMEALAHYVHLWTYGRVKLEWRVIPEEPESAYVLPHPMRYYGNPDHFEQGLVNLARDALLAADQDPRVSFEDIDGNGVRDYEEGVLPRYVIFHAGSAWQTDINWDTPYDIAAVTLPPGIFEYYLGVPYILLNEGQDTVYDVAILPETMSQDQTVFALQGTLIHEAGHFLFFQPDLYDISGRGSGIGAWGIMGSGSYLSVPGAIPPGLMPPLPNAWERYFTDSIVHLLWNEPYDASRGFLSGSMTTVFPPSRPRSFTLYPGMILTDSTGRFLEPPASRSRFLRIVLSPTEWYMLEVKTDNLRANDSAYVCNGDTISTAVYGRWKDGVVVHFYGENDYLLPGSGLLIWHVDNGILQQEYVYNTVNAVRPMGVDLVEADGVQDLERYRTGGVEEIFGSARDPFYRGNNALLAPWSFPAATLNRGGDAPVVVEGISEPGDSMTFQLRPPDLLPPFPLILEDSAGRWALRANRNHVVIADLAGPPDTGRLATLWLLQGETLVPVIRATTPRRFLATPPLLVGDTLVLLWSTGDLEALELQEGRRLWQVPIRGQFAFGTLQENDGQVWIPLESGEVVAFRLADGQEILRTFVGEPVRGRVGFLGDTVLVQGTSGRVFFLHRQTGEIFHTFGETSGSPTVGGVILLARDGATEIGVWVSETGWLRYRPDGRLIEHRPFSEPNLLPPVVYTEGKRVRIAVAVPGGVLLLSSEGSLLHRLDFGDDPSGLVGVDGGLVVQVPGKGTWVAGRFVVGDLHTVTFPALVDWDDNGTLEVMGYTGKLVVARSVPFSRILSTSHHAPLIPVEGGSVVSLRVDVYPNPVYRGRRAFLRLESPTGGEGILEIFTFGGERVARKRFGITGGIQDITLPVEHLAAGPYFVVVSVETGSRSYTRRVKFLVSPRGLFPDSR